MDAAKDAMGHGRPFAAGLWNGDSKNPKRSAGLDAGASVLGFFCRD